MVKGVLNRGRPKNQWLDNISEWTKMDNKDLVNVVRDRDGWRKCVSM